MSGLDATQLRTLHPRLQVDRLRNALRQGTIDRSQALRELDQWIALFQASDDAGLKVLVLELLGDAPDPRILQLAESARLDPGDGVRLEALRILLDRDPDRIVPLAAEYRDDDSLEVRLLVVEHWYSKDPNAALDLLFEALEEESLGPKENHALERGTEFLVETVQDATLVPRLLELKDSCRDPEGFLDWAMEKLNGN